MGKRAPTLASYSSSCNHTKELWWTHIITLVYRSVLLQRGDRKDFKELDNTHLMLTPSANRVRRTYRPSPERTTLQNYTVIRIRAWNTWYQWYFSHSPLIPSKRIEVYLWILKQDSFKNFLTNISSLIQLIKFQSGINVLFSTQRYFRKIEPYFTIMSF